MESKLPTYNKRRFKSNLGSMFSVNTELKSIDDNNLLVQDDNVQGDNHINSFKARICKASVLAHCSLTNALVQTHLYSSLLYHLRYRDGTTDIRRE